MDKLRNLIPKNLNVKAKQAIETLKKLDMKQKIIIMVIVILILGFFISKVTKNPDAVIDIGNNIDVGKSMTIGDNVDVGKSMTVGGDADVGGNVNVGKSMTVSDIVNVGNSMIVGGNITANNITANNITANNIPYLRFGTFVPRTYTYTTSNVTLVERPFNFTRIGNIVSFNGWLTVSVKTAGTPKILMSNDFPGILTNTSNIFHAIALKENTILPPTSYIRFWKEAPYQILSVECQIDEINKPYDIYLSGSYQSQYGA